MKCLKANFHYTTKKTKIKLDYQHLWCLINLKYAAEGAKFLLYIVLLKYEKSPFLTKLFYIFDSNKTEVFSQTDVSCKLNKMRKENSTNFINNSTLENFCNAHKVLSKISGRWKLSIIFALSEKQINYSDFKIILPNITDRILSKQLKELKIDGIIGNKKNKLESIYFLTENGKKFMDILSSFKTFNFTAV